MANELAPAVENSKTYIGGYVMVLVGNIWFHGIVVRIITPLIFQVRFSSKEKFNAGILDRIKVFDIYNLKPI